MLVAPALSPSPEAAAEAGPLPASAAAVLPAPAAAAVTAATTTTAEPEAASGAANGGISAPPPRTRPNGRPVRTALAPLAAAVGATTAAAASVATAVLTAVLTPAAAAVLRLTVARRSFWVRGLSSARGDGGAGLPPALVDGYRRAEGVRGWEAGLLAFSRAMAASRGGRMTRRRGTRRGYGSGGGGGGPVGREGAAAPAGAVRGGHQDDLASRLATTGVPTLIIHGAADRLVPVRNSEALVRRWGTGGKPQAGGAWPPTLVVMNGVGHVPHEEAADRWVRHVDEFLGGVRQS